MRNLVEDVRLRKPAHEQNPPKTKTIIRRGHQVDFKGTRAALGDLTHADFAVLSLIQTLSNGWQTTVDWLADQLKKSRATVYRAIARLKAKRYLVELTEGVVIVSWRPAPVSQSCEPAGATPKQEKEKPDAREPTDKQPTKEPTVKHYGTADANGRPELDWDSPDRMHPTDFLEAWMGTIDGRMKLHLAPRDIHAMDYWTAAELELAFEATGKANRPSWGYFRAVLERIAKGELAPPRKLSPEHEDTGRLDDYAEHRAPKPERQTLTILAELKSEFGLWGKGDE